MYNQIFSTNIARVLDELGMSKNTLSEKAGVSISFISGLTLDKANPSLRIMEAIANALETPLTVLLDQTNLPETDMEKLMDGAPKSILPKGLVRVTATLNEYQAYQVELWDIENKKKLLKK